ncbi:hypothetical protein PsYK624_146740 [Phanerochaete sordida]|uniref:Uncharacterized protein n=1 Tax=Phanerochaete sordida TaxID=48140 RepID=A0A9P3GQE1_9APHY|nr:hypothetical protein PsYK624_146740 [Phanerochaete sordida]
MYAGLQATGGRLRMGRAGTIDVRRSQTTTSGGTRADKLSAPAMRSVSSPTACTSVTLIEAPLITSHPFAMRAALGLIPARCARHSGTFQRDAIHSPSPYLDAGRYHTNSVKPRCSRRPLLAPPRAPAVQRALRRTSVLVFARSTKPDTPCSLLKGLFAFAKQSARAVSIGRRDVRAIDCSEPTETSEGATSGMLK